MDHKIKGKIKYLVYGLIAAGVLVAFLAEISVAKAEVKKLRMGLISAEGHPVTKASRKFAELVKERTNGEIQIEVFAGGALGGEVEMQDMLSVGTLDLASMGNGIPPTYNPQFQLLQMPYLWDSQDQMLAFAKSEIQEEMNERYLKASGVRILASNWDQGARHTLSKRPIYKVEDFKGLKIRVPQIPAWVDMWQILGTIPTQIAFPEVYTALQQGVVDAMECPLYWIYASSFHEQAKYLILTGHIMYYNQVFINERVFQSLSPEYQRIIKEAALEAGEYETELTRTLEEDI
ncbi:TRAP transporter substrate-binding protein, partial [Candidatus Aerophobetes bacterium]|nr:TRAP transporter substrate-binding protein [Candidatus Aerophobetes bacterium]